MNCCAEKKITCIPQVVRDPVQFLQKKINGKTGFLLKIMIVILFIMNWWRNTKKVEKMNEEEGSQ